MNPGRREEAGAHARSVAVSLLIAVVMVAGVIFWWKFQATRPWHPAIRHREAATRILAEHLAARFPQAKCLIVANPFALKSGQSGEIVAFEEASIRGVEAGLGQPGLAKVAYPELRPEVYQAPDSVYVDPRTTTPLSFLITTNAFDQLARNYPDKKIILSLVGLPLNAPQLECWRDPQKPVFAFLLPDWRILGDRAAVAQAFASGKIAAAVLALPGAPPEEEPDLEDARAEFDRRFLLVTRENVEKLMASHPKLF